MAEIEHRIILETGTGNDLYGEDYTKAACRAVRGGLNVHDPENGTTHVIATAAVEAWVPVDAAAWKLADAG